MHRNAYHAKRRARKGPAKAGCAVCGKPYEKRGNQKTCGRECSERLRIKYHQDYYKPGGDEDGGVNEKWTAYRATDTRKRIERAGTISGKCVICGNRFETHDRRRKTCSPECSAANSSGPAAVREAVMAAVQKAGAGRRRRKRKK